MCMVSVIIPYFNRGDTLPRALDSVRAQSYQDLEIILVNDGSTDQTSQLVEAYIQDHPELHFKHLWQKNSGPSGARNNAIRHATGRYIACLDSDDAWEPQKLAIQIDFMERNSEVGITGTNYYIVKEHQWHKYNNVTGSVEVGFYRVLFKSLYLTSTVIMRTDIFRRDNIWFQEGKNQGEDLLLFLQILRKYKGALLYQPLASYFKFEYGEEGLTSDLGKLLANELDNLKLLYAENELSEKKISYGLFILLNIYTYLKHDKRVLLNTWHKIQSSNASG
ncbi:MAG: glycosyltransferase family 2 protein [Peptococcaceae bacterium]|nr:glycosyltransferase family 2 protein [Peptococcaceae bacterium]